MYVPKKQQNKIAQQVAKQIQQEIRSAKTDLDITDPQSAERAVFQRNYETMKYLESGDLFYLPDEELYKMLGRKVFKARCSLAEKQYHTVLSPQGEKALLCCYVVDDWKDIWNSAVKYGGKALEMFKPHLYELAKTGIETAGNWIGQQLGGTTEVAKPPSQSISTGVTSINYKALATLICPEYYKDRVPLQSSALQKSALAQGNATYNLTTNAAGNVVFWVNALNLVASFDAAKSETWFGSMLNNNNLNLTTGDNTVNTTSAYPGPLSTSQLIKVSRISSVSIQLIPLLAPTQSAGNIITCFYQDSPLLNLQYPARFFPPFAEIVNCPFYRIDTTMSRPRSILVYGDITTSRFVPQTEYNSSESVFLIVVTGAPANTNVFRLLVSYVVEYAPNSAYYSQVQTEYPDAGPATMQAYQLMIASHPHLQQYDVKHAAEVAQKIIHHQDVDVAYQHLSQTKQSYAPKSHLHDMFHPPLEQLLNENMSQSEIEF